MSVDLPADPGIILAAYAERCAPSLGVLMAGPFAFVAGDPNADRHLAEFERLDAQRAYGQATHAGWKWDVKRATFRRPAGMWCRYHWRWAVVIALWVTAALLWAWRGVDVVVVAVTLAGCAVSLHLWASRPSGALGPSDD